MDITNRIQEACDNGQYAGFIETTDPPTTYPPTYVKIEDQILNMFSIL